MCTLYAPSSRLHHFLLFVEILIDLIVGSSCKAQTLCCDTENVGHKCYVSEPWLTDEFIFDVINACSEPSEGSGSSGGIRG